MATKTVNTEIQHAIKTNSRGVSRLLLNYPLDLRTRAARMAQAIGVPQQEVIRSAIDQFVSEWERANPETKPTRKPRSKKAGAK